MLKTLFEEKGNYKRIKIDENQEKFTYFGNVICIVDNKRKVFHLDDCGYGSYRSTVRALNDLRRYYTNNNYAELINLEVK